MPRRKNYSIVIFELFFGSPEDSVYNHDESGVVLEKTGFAVQKGLTKYIVKLDPETYKKHPNIELYWVQGLFKRDDVDKRLKGRIKRRLLARKIKICTKVAVKRVTEKFERK